VNVMGYGWMEFGQSWPRKGAEGKPMGNEGFMYGPFQGQQWETGRWIPNRHL
jgi:hypothetical protein